MQFLQTSPVVLPRSDAGSQYEYWALDLSDSRPPYGEIEEFGATIQGRAKLLQEVVQKSVVQCAAIYVDQYGILFLAKTNTKQQMSNAKSGIGNLLGKVHESYRQLVQSKLRPLDEYDRSHIQEWQTVDVILDHFKDYLDDAESHLALADQAVGEVEADDMAIFRDPKLDLKYTAKQTGTVQLISIGDWPGEMFCTACTHEARRTAWLAERLEEYDKPGLLAAVKESVELHKEGVLPLPKSKTAIFLERCKTRWKGGPRCRDRLEEATRQAATTGTDGDGPGGA